MDLKAVFQTALISELRLPNAITVSSGSSLREVATLMREKRIGSIPVVDSEGKLTGIFTERDWLKRVLNKPVDLASPIDSVMTRAPMSLHEFDPIGGAVTLMTEKRVRHIPIVDDKDRPKSMLSVRDLLLHIAECFPESVLAQPPLHQVVSLREEGG